MMGSPKRRPSSNAMHGPQGRRTARDAGKNGAVTYHFVPSGPVGTAVSV